MGSTIKTLVNDASVEDFINSVPDELKRKDSFALLSLFTKITGEEPKMWGASIIGFGQYHFKSERSRQEGDWLLTGFSPRKQALTLYIMHGNEDSTDLLQKLGKYKTGMGCMYINKLSDIDIKVLERLVDRNYRFMRKNNR